MQDGLIARVVGPSAILPRGFLWLAPVWYAPVALALVTNSWPAQWFRLSAVAGLLVAVITFMLTLSMVSVHAFAANDIGIRIGLPATTRRRGRRRRQARELTWAQIERLRIARRPYGSRLEIMLSQDAPLTIRPHRASDLAALFGWLLMLAVPLTYRWRRTSLVSPVDEPARYRVALRDLTAEEARAALRALAPPDVEVAVKTRKRRTVSSAPSARTTLPQAQQS
jgi:hypothetical protein